MRVSAALVLWLVLFALAVSAGVAGAGPPTQVALQIVPDRDGPRPYPVLSEYPFQLAADSSYTLDEATQELVSAGQASVSTSYAWTYDPAQLVAAAPDETWGQFLYGAKYAETDQVISVTCTVTVTYVAALDRSPDEATATDTLAIDVIGMGGGGMLLAQAAELYVVPAAQSGEVCDRWEVRVKVYKPDVLDKLWWCQPGQNWASMVPSKLEETGQYIVYTWLWESHRDKNAGVDWKATYNRLVFTPPPGHWDILETGTETWTPNNTVLTGSDKVLKWAPDVPANCDTDATFSISHLNYGSPDWNVTVKIYNAAGGLVKTIVQNGGFDLGPNTVAWDGMADAIPPADPEEAPKGLYTYTVEAVHNQSILMYCLDTEKSTHLSVSGAFFTEWNADWDNWQVTAKAGYTLSQAAQEARVRVFAPDFTCIYDSDTDENAVVPVAAGANETGEFTLTLPDGDHPLRRLHGSSGRIGDHCDRDREQPRRGSQMGASVGCPGPRRAEDYDADFTGDPIRLKNAKEDWGSFTPAAANAVSDQQSGTSQRPAYSAVAHSNHSAEDAWSRLSRNSVVFIAGHASGAPVGQEFYTSGDGVSFLQPQYSSTIADRHGPAPGNGEIFTSPEAWGAVIGIPCYYVGTDGIGDPLDLSRMQLGFFGGCETGGTDGIAKAAVDAGAHSAVGFLDTGPWNVTSEYFYHEFWTWWMGASDNDPTGSLILATSYIAEDPYFVQFGKPGDCLCGCNHWEVYLKEGS